MRVWVIVVIVSILAAGALSVWAGEIGGFWFALISLPLAVGLGLAVSWPRIAGDVMALISKMGGWVEGQRQRIAHQAERIARQDAQIAHQAEQIARQDAQIAQQAEQIAHQAERIGWARVVGAVELWAEVYGSIDGACKQLKIARATFYNYKKYLDD